MDKFMHTQRWSTISELPQVTLFDSLVKVTIHLAFSSAEQLLFKVGLFIIDGLVGAKLLQPSTLVVAACDADDLGCAEVTGVLRDNVAHRAVSILSKCMVAITKNGPCCSTDDYGLTTFELQDVGQSEVGCQTVGAQSKQRSNRAKRNIPRT